MGQSDKQSFCEDMFTFDNGGKNFESKWTSKLQLLQLGTESIPPKMAKMAAVTFDTKISDTGDIFPTCSLSG